MLINNKQTNVKFISYIHDISLCHGELKFELNNNIYEFSSKLRNVFWVSGGSVGFNKNYTKSYITTDEWIIDVDKLPDELKIYASDIDTMINDEMPYGCCGACL